MERLRGEGVLVAPFRIIRIVLLGLGLYIIFVALFSRNIADYDLWGYLSFGSVYWDNGYFPFQDVFSYTPVKPLWVYHEWLTGIIFYFIYKHAGPAGLQLLHYLVVLLTICLMYQTALKKGAGTRSALFVLVIAMLLISFGYVPVRAQIFTYLFFALTVYILECARKEERWSLLWLLPPIQILWCNLHGGYVAGLGLIFLYALGDVFSGRKPVPLTPINRVSALMKIFSAGKMQKIFSNLLIAILFPAALATLINPYGFKYWSYTLQAITMPRPEIEEWLSVLVALQRHVQVVPVMIFLSLALIHLLLLLFQRERNWTDLLVVAVTIYLGCSHIRHSILYGLIMGSHMPVLLSGYWHTWQKRGVWVTLPTRLPRFLLLILIFSCSLYLNPSLWPARGPSFALATPVPDYPLGAVAWIKTNGFKGNILPHFEWGEFMIWTCYPACRVAMDGRYETVYQERVAQEYFDFLQGRAGWKVFLEKYPHDMVLIKPFTKTHLLMLREPSWRKVYADRSCVIFIKSEQGARHPYP